MSSLPPVMDEYDGLKSMLPRLAQPSWVWQIGTPRLANEILIALTADSQDRKAKQKDAKKRYNAAKRLLHAIHGTA